MRYQIDASGILDAIKSQMGEDYFSEYAISHIKPKDMISYISKNFDVEEILLHFDEDEVIECIKDNFNLKELINEH